MKSLLLVCFYLSVFQARAFPPAPYYTLYGLVRDQVGQTLTAEGASIILLNNGAEVARTPISPIVTGDKTYELKIRLDQNQSGTTRYSEKAINANGLFSLVVEMNGVLFYPIEVAGNLTAGKGGERIRLDLNLGADTDLDGLPDVWEQWQLYQAGYQPDTNGNWPINLINRDGDLDHDGKSNYMEYLAGTFAGDATEHFELKITQKTSSTARFDFYAITGKTYGLERSFDLVTWVPVPFSIGTQTAGNTFYTATDVSILTAFATPSVNPKEFYRLNVR